MLQDFKCAERNQQDTSDDASPDDDVSPAASTLSLPPLNLLASMRDSSDEEGDKHSLPQQQCVTAHIMRNFAKHRQAANHIPSARSDKLRKFLHSQRIFAKDATNVALSNDMPDNEDEEAEPAKRRHLEFHLRPGSHASPHETPMATPWQF